FRCKLEDSGTYRISAQNYKGEISSYATLVVRRYDGSKSGYYDIKSGYNLKKPSDYPDVEGLDVPEETPEKKQDSIFISCITATEVPEVKCSKVVSFAAPDAEKYESVLEMHIKGESPIEPIKVLRNIEDKQAGEDNNVRKSKPEVSNELGDFLSMEVNQLEPKRESSILGDVIIEDIVPVKSTHNIKDNDFEE
uniref:Uncharacterized protein n=1 Tax=Ciona savignyi TaxID=51511 RepID=H2YJI6_CIOSA